MIGRQLLVIAGLGVNLTLGCGQGPTSARPVDNQARQVVQQFVSLDTAHLLSDSVLARLVYCPTGLMEEGEEIQPTAGFAVLAVTHVRDVIEVPVRYDLLGFGQGLDTHSVGAKNLAFVPRIASVTDTLPVVRDAAGDLKIGCGYPTPNHISAARFDRWRSRMTTGSLVAWDSVWKPTSGPR